MKMLLALLLALMLVSLSAFALAEGDPVAEPGETAEPAETLELDRNTMTGTTEVSLTVDRSMDTYTVIIPSKVTIDPKTQYGYGDVVLKAGWELVSVNSLKVQLSGAENGIADNFYINTTSFEYTNSLLPYYQNFKLKNSDKTVPYAIKASTVSWPYTKTNHNGRGYYGISSTERYGYGAAYDTAMITISKKNSSNTEDIVSNMVFYVKDMPTDPGIYTDTLTFSIITE